jgi:hypothetical protein
MSTREFNRETAEYSMRAIRRAIWNVFLPLVWAAWWGGLCFYAVVVVPIGTEVVGSVEQGFITQRVTQWHNGLSGLFLVCLMIEAIRRRIRVLWAIAVTLAIIDIALVVWHTKLTRMMDFEQHSVSGGFYTQHAIYLWLTATEWFLGLTIPIWIVPSRHDVQVAVRRGDGIERGEDQT